MAKKARQKISYVLPLANSSGGHRLGINGLAIDPHNSLLYSGGRDGSVCAWDLNLNLQERSDPVADEKKIPRKATTIRQQIQAHTHWINDIALAQSNSALVSASSDLTVKVWRPAAQDAVPPQTIGLHTDYVKVLAVPDEYADWVASGGLDRRICLWDLGGSGKKLSIDTTEDEGGSVSNKDKGSVYALDVTPSIIASGGPESIVRVWDTKSGKRITKFVGHTDNIRDILISANGENILTASSDQTVKVWSVTAGRCMHTLTMHDASVWSLWSNDPQLSVFYSSDRSGLIAKTDTRGCVDYDEGLSVAVAQEHEGITKLVSAGEYIWTATSRPSINRWNDVDTDNAEAMMPEGFMQHRFSLTNARSRTSIAVPQHQPVHHSEQAKKQIPLKHVLRLSNMAYFPTHFTTDIDTNVNGARRPTISAVEDRAHVVVSVHAAPESSIEGQNGLIKHVMLSDRRRVLTLDTAGEVIMWDLLTCTPTKSFGKRHIEDVQPEVNTMETVANWCSIDTRTGSLAITLEENTCFDAELYADDLEEYKDVNFKEDQRINLGKWVLRYLFASIISEEVRRDQWHRKQITAAQYQGLDRDNAPTGLQLPANQLCWQGQDSSSNMTTLRLGDASRSLATPGMAISLATPGQPAKHSLSANIDSTIEEHDHVGGVGNDANKARQSADYFSVTPSPNPQVLSPQPHGKESITPAPAEVARKSVDDAKDATVEQKDTPSKFGKKFKMNMSFSMKKLGRNSNADKEKLAGKNEKEEPDSDTRSNKTSDSRQVDDNFAGCIQRIHIEYKDRLQEQSQSQRQGTQDAISQATRSPESGLDSLIVPSLPSETPVLRPPPNTTILIQEDRPEAGGVVDLFEGTVGSLHSSIDTVESVAPMWLADVLLRNQLPIKDVVKISFVLDPWQGQLPPIATDGNNRLNANRMLRARKILSYVAERIEPTPPQDSTDPVDHLQPEDYLELWCNNQRIPPKMTLATIRSHIWRGGGDVNLYYKANGKKVMKPIPPQPTPGTEGLGPIASVGSTQSAATGGVATKV